MGWTIVGLAAIALSVLLARFGIYYGVDEEGVRAIIRLTARTSLLFFTAAFSASALYTLWPNRGTEWLRSNRRYFGVSFALSHTAHFAAVYAVAQLNPERFFEQEGRTLFGRESIPVWILLAMLATSFDRPAALIGRHAWKALHLVGTHLFWLALLGSFGRLAVAQPAYAPLALALIASMLLRLWAMGVRLLARQRTRRSATPA